MNAKQRVASRGIMQALKALVDGKALDIVKGVQENGMIENKMDNKPANNEDFGIWYYDWRALV